MTPRRYEQRLEEEIAGVERPERVPSLSGDYLMQAIEALHSAADPASLYEHWRRHPPRDPAAERERMVAAARRQRLKQARTAVLLAALAAEAYVNEFLGAHDALGEWDRQPPHRKYLKGTEAAYGERLFLPDREPYPVLVALFKLRDRLVHPKPGFGVRDMQSAPEPEFELLFDLPTVANYIVMVGGAADVLVPRAYGFESFEVVSRVAWLGRSVIRDFAARLEDLPDWDATAERALFRQAGDHVMRLRPPPDHPDASWTRLRQAREQRS